MFKPDSSKLGAIILLVLPVVLLFLVGAYYGLKFYIKSRRRPRSVLTPVLRDPRLPRNTPGYTLRMNVLARSQLQQDSDRESGPPPEYSLPERPPSIFLRDHHRALPRYSSIFFAEPGNPFVIGS